MVYPVVYSLSIFFVWVILFVEHVDSEIEIVYGNSVGDGELFHHFELLKAEKNDHWFDSFVASGCGGTLLNSRTVLTAAHCVQKGVLYAVGPDSRNDITTFKVERIYVHPKFNAEKENGEKRAFDYNYFDLAIVQLEKDVPEDEGTGFISINYDDIPEGTEVTVQGMGSIPSLINGELYAELSTVKRRRFSFFVDSWEKCAEEYSTSKGILQSVPNGCHCGGDGRSHVLGGDSGSGVVSEINGNLYVVGVMIGGPCVEADGESLSPWNQTVEIVERLDIGYHVYVPKLSRCFPLRCSNVFASLKYSRGWIESVIDRIERDTGLKKMRNEEVAAIGVSSLILIFVIIVFVSGIWWLWRRRFGS